MWSVLALAAIERAANFWIDLDAATRQQIGSLQGQLLRVVVNSPSMSVDVSFSSSWMHIEPTALDADQKPAQSIFEQRPYEQQHAAIEATATLEVKNAVELFTLLLSAEHELGNIPLTGDYRLLMKLRQILQQSEPDLASHLSPWIGAVSAHEIGKMARKLPNHLAQRAASLDFMLSEWVKEDSQLFAARWKIQKAQQDLRHLKLETERLELKWQKLQQRFHSSAETTLK